MVSYVYIPSRDLDAAWNRQIDRKFVYQKACVWPLNAFTGVVALLPLLYYLYTYMTTGVLSTPYTPIINTTCCAVVVLCYMQLQQLMRDIETLQLQHGTKNTVAFVFGNSDTHLTTCNKNLLEQTFIDTNRRLPVRFAFNNEKIANCAIEHFVNANKRLVDPTVENTPFNAWLRDHGTALYTSCRPYELRLVHTMYLNSTWWVIEVGKNVSALEPVNVDDGAQ